MNIEIPRGIYLLSICLAVLTLGYAPNLPAQPGAVAEKVPPVIVATAVVSDQFGDTLEALGTTRANESVEISANLTEFVRDIRFEDGDRVNHGDVLVVLEKDEEEAQLKSARAVYDERKAAYERARELVRQQAVSTATLEEREALLRQIEGTIEALEAQIRDRTIKAPFDGVLGLREVSKGALVRPGDVITTLDDVSRIKVDFDAPSVFLSSLQPGLAIRGRVNAYGSEVFTGNVSTISSRVDPVTRTVSVRAILPNENGVLRPGLLMSIALTKNPRQALLIPEGAIVQRGTRSFVYAVNDGENGLVANEKEVTTGTRVPGKVEVLSGLAAGERIVVHGLMQVRNGGRVEIQGVQDGGESLIDFTGDTLRNNGAQ